MNLSLKVEEVSYKAKMNDYYFRLTDEKWKLDKSITISPIEVIKNTSSDIQYGYIHTLAYFASNFSGGYVSAINNSFKKFFTTSEIKIIDGESILRFKAGLKEHEVYCLCRMKSFLERWMNFNYPGIHSSSVVVFNDMKVKRGAIGEAVKRRDPNAGPFTDNELYMLKTKTQELLSEGKINLSLFCFLHLLISTGRRPVQLTSLKHIDLKKDEKGANINIPRVKQQLTFRESFTSNILAERLFSSLLQLKEQTIKYIETKFGEELEQHVKDLLPIFLNNDAVNSCTSLLDLKQKIYSDFLHAQNELLTNKLRNMAKQYGLISERTGNIIKLNPRRFRYTLGSILAKNGASISEIAQALDHSDISSAGIYIKNVADNVAKIDSHMNKFLSPLSNVFMGLDVESNSQEFINVIKDAFCINESVQNEIKCFECKKFNQWRTEDHV
ncbi:tyrosine-type recombinase/integrase [Pantoea agglomerans]|uniref:tyrosine-type recombinase/integrase n=1 Tax=Enterobacter agglomerans TaxID=549 RepID=UPI003C7B8DF9